MNFRIGAMMFLCAIGYLATPAPAWSEAQVNERSLRNENQMTDFEVEELYRTYEYDKLLLGPDWFHSRGYGHVQNESYRAYNDAELLSVAQADDPIAQVIAVETLLFKTNDNEDFQELMRFHESAIVNGYTSTLMDVIVTYLFRANYYGDVVAPTLPIISNTDAPLVDSLVDNTVKGNAMKALVWQLFAQMRSDPRGGLHGPGLAAHGFTDADAAKACDLANQLYGKLNDVRVSRGYRAFAFDLPTLSPTDISNFGDLCTNWPVPRLHCVQQKVDVELVPLSGYRCIPATEAGGMTSSIRRK